MPDELQQRATAFRALMADKRMLVVLDDVTGHEQVALLLPGCAGCGVIVTSRARLTDIPGGHLIETNALPAREAHTLLARVAGSERIAAEPAAAADLIRLCGGLPLAVRIVAAKLAARPHRSLAQLVVRMADERSRLDELAFGTMDVRRGLTLSYLTLSSRASRLLRKLSQLDIPLFRSSACTLVLDTSPTEAEDLIDELVTARLLDVEGCNAAGQISYRFSELTLLYAREMARAEETYGVPSRQYEIANPI
jgi:hypothetical protein